ITEADTDRVMGTGAAGQPPSDRLKLVAGYRDGGTASGMLGAGGPAAEANARAAGGGAPHRAPRGGGPRARPRAAWSRPGAVVGARFEGGVRVGVRDPDRATVDRF